MEPIDIVQKMYDNDSFSQWLGIEIIELSEGHCKVQMRVRAEMTNGFGIAHGGITYSIADSAFAFASNSRGVHAVSLETSISHLHPVKVDDLLLAEAKEINVTRKTGLYTIRITNQHNTLVAQFKGTVYRKSQKWK